MARNVHVARWNVLKKSNLEEMAQTIVFRDLKINYKFLDNESVKKETSHLN